MNPANRRYVFVGFAAIALILYIVRLFYVQIVDDQYKLDASNQSFLYVTDYPPRGAIYDRNGKLLVFNQVAYDLMVVPRNMKDCDTAGLCQILNITKDEFDKRLIKFSGSLKEAARDYRSYIFESQMLPELNARLQERLYKFNGFYVQSRTVRIYSMPIAAHLLGYVSEVSDNFLKKDTTGYYKSGDYVGASGIEKSYEEYLRGTKGVQIKMRDVHNNLKGSFADGKYDTAAVPGLSLTSTLDANLQLYAEQLMVNKIGGIAAIDPTDGEILALVTSPTYDPNLLVGRDLSINYRILSNDTIGKPLFNRALQAMYPPGSTFKLMNSLIAQQEGVLTAATTYPCHGGYPPLGGHPKCEIHASPLDLTGAIQHSCNSYFSYVFHSIVANPKYKTDRDGFEAWRNYVLSFGVGKKMGTDLPFDQKGNVPTAKDYDKVFGKGGWNASTVTGVGLGIGQGELLITPLQMCNIICSIANRGYYYTPHIIKYIGEGANKKILPQWTIKNYTMVTDTSYYNVVINGMAEVVKAGTARASAIPGIEMCGKTGTAQNPHGDDHSVFVCFAPRDHPKIAVAILVENAGWGAQWAAPIASLIVEKYLTGKISAGRIPIETKMLQEDLIHTTGKPKAVVQHKTD
ncbi:MAG TPA: penicillin-binding transpeptidase domain-containing protein [Bacteroidia bacterium]|jgi:penicillin-binding protein 2|nr:penicillin-binding transpeptidase domain-containing protein [Bacteroidia bacterium]